MNTSTTQEITGASEIEGLVVNYSEARGRRMSDSRGRPVGFEEGYVKALKAKQDFAKEAEAIINELKLTHEEEAKVLTSSVKTMLSGLTKVANEIGHGGKKETSLNIFVSTSMYKKVENICVGGAQQTEVKAAIENLEKAFQNAEKNMREAEGNS